MRIARTSLILVLLLCLCACGSQLEEKLTWQEQYDLGVRYLEEGDYEEAIIAFTAAIEIDPKRAEAYTSLAEIYMELGDYDEAVDILEQGIANLDKEDAKELEELLSNARWMASIDFENLVTDAYRETLTNVFQEESEWAVPQIMLDNPHVAAINQEIWETVYEGVVQSAIRNVEEYEAPVGQGVSYRWAVNGDILSLWIQSDPVDWAWTDFYIYNVSISSGKKLTDRKVYQAVGFTKSEYQERVREAAGSDFWSVFVSDPEWLNYIAQTDAEFFNTQLQNTISQENIEQAEPFLNEDGQLCVVIPIYSIAGAEYYWTLLNLEDFELVPDFEKGI